MSILKNETFVFHHRLYPADRHPLQRSREDAEQLPLRSHGSTNARQAREVFRAPH